MYSKAGLTKVFTVIPIKVKGSENAVLTNASVSITVRLKDHTKLVIMDKEKIKEKISKSCSKGFFNSSYTRTL